MSHKFMKGWAAEISMGLGLAFILVGLSLIVVRSETKEIQKEIQELRGELKARGEFISHLQEEVDYANAKATWLLKKIDKRRVLIPVLDGSAYKIVEISIEPESLEDSPDEQQQD